PPAAGRVQAAGNQQQRRSVTGRQVVDLESPRLDLHPGTAVYPPERDSMLRVRVTLAATSPAELQVDALAIPVAAGEELGPEALQIDSGLGGLLRELTANGEHRGRVNEVLTLPTSGRIGARRLLLYGLGASRDLDGQRLRVAHHEMVRAARTYGYRRLAILSTSPLKRDDLDAVVEGSVMGTFEPRSRQTAAKPDRVSVDEILLAGSGLRREHEVGAGVERGEATNRAREWRT